MCCAVVRIQSCIAYEAIKQRRRKEFNQSNKEAKTKNPRPAMTRLRQALLWDFESVCTDLVFVLSYHRATTQGTKSANKEAHQLPVCNSFSFFCHFAGNTFIASCCALSSL
jgi:hypothetical protein